MIELFLHHHIFTLKSDWEI